MTGKILPAVSGQTADSLLAAFTSVAIDAAAAILAEAAAGLMARIKPDDSPVTAADEASERVILAELNKILPGVPIISEESHGQGASVSRAARFVLVDPLDGTRELLAGRDEYTVNIALIDGGRPLIGVIAAPALGRLWRGIVGQGAERLEIGPGVTPQSAGAPVTIRTRAQPETGPVAIVSRSHLDPETIAYLARIRPAEKIPCGSSLKFCRLAEGSADIYPRLAPTSEWDIAAGHALLVAAGGILTKPDGSPLLYGQDTFRVPGFIAWGVPNATRDH